MTERWSVGLRWAAGAWSGWRTHRGTLRIRPAASRRRGDGEPTVSVDLEPLEALAALTGRRSLDQVRAYAWDGDVDPWLPAFTWGPFVPPAEVLFEQRFWEPIARGEVTVTFRRWKRRQAIAGNRYRTPTAIIEADAVDIVDRRRHHRRRRAGRRLRRPRRR